jgi:hypothetical protein
MCTVLLPPGGYPIAVNKYNMSYIISYQICVSTNEKTGVRKAFYNCVGEVPRLYLNQSAGFFSSASQGITRFRSFGPLKILRHVEFHWLPCIFLLFVQLITCTVNTVTLFTVGARRQNLQLLSHSAGHSILIFEVVFLWIKNIGRER